LLPSKLLFRSALTALAALCARQRKSILSIVQRGSDSTGRTGRHKVDGPAAAFRAHEALDPIDRRQIVAVACGMLGRVGLEICGAITHVPKFV